MMPVISSRLFCCRVFIVISITLFCTISNAHAAVVISEFMASNDGTILDEDGEASDWRQLLNDGPSAVNLNGWYLTDDDEDLTAWQFPNITIAADAYIIVFASNNDRTDPNSELHSNFKLGSGGEYLALIANDGTTVVDEFSPEYPQQYEDISYGEEGYFVNPTPGMPNNAAIIGFAEAVEFGLEHGFYDSPQSLSLSSELSGATIRYTLDGSLPPTDLSCEAPSDGKSWSYNYYEDPTNFWTSMPPNFALLTPVSSGTADIISTDVKERNDYFAIQFTGCVEALADGVYTFETSSDDGSQLYVNDILEVDNTNNNGSNSTVSNQVSLDKGLHKITVSYFQSTGDSSLSANWTAPLRGATTLFTEDEGMTYPAESTSNNYIEFEFDLPSSGTFNLNATVQGPDANANSFWVQLDDESLSNFEFNTSTSLNTVTILTTTLTAGEHRLKVFPQEDGAIIDSITIAGTSCDGPCEAQTIEAEIQDSSGIFQYAGLNSEVLPGEKWLTYSSPILIDKTSIIRAIATKQDYLAGDVATQTYLFLDDVIVQSTNEETPEYWIEESTAQDMDYGMDPDIVNADPQAVKDSLASLPSISVVTEIDNLLHPNIGIYVNAQEKGRYWERPASIELIDGTGSEAGFTIDAGIRIRGGFSRRPQNPRHPFRIYFRNDYGGDLDYPLFGSDGIDEFEKIDLRAPNNYSWAQSASTKNTLLREVWSRDTQAALGLPHTRSRYYHLYLNGQYWGVHMTQERISKEYAESYFDGDEDDYDVVKHNRQDGYRFEANDGTTESWIEVWDIISDQTVTPAEYTELEAQVDLDNLIDYIVINGYEGDLDGATSWFLSRWLRANNWYAVRDREGDTLKWTFFQHDGEHTLGVYPNTTAMLAIENTLGPFAPFNGSSNSFFSRDYMNPYWLHAALTSNSDYRQKAIDRTAELFAPGGALSTEQALGRWDIREAEVADAILAQSARWGDSKSPNSPLTITDWQNEVSNVENNFFPGRSETVYDQLIALGLASDIELPTLSIPSGSVVSTGTVVTIINNAPTGTIYYTTDGSDPRESGGGLSANAIELTNGQLTIDGETNLVFRVLLADGSWSTLISAHYSIESDGCYVIPTKNDNVVVFCL